jgi:predicted porin
MQVKPKWIIVIGAIIIGFSPLLCQAAEIKAGDWLLNLGGALRMSYNEEDCDDTCQDIWRSPDPDTTADEDSDTYLTGDISQISISGKRQMDYGMNAVFKTEWRLDSPEGDDETILTNYEQYLGVDTALGLLRAGTIETSYMQTGNLLDPFSSDALSTRFFVDIQSALHHNTGKGRGRATNTLRYDSPISESGMTAQLFMVIDNSEDADHGYGGGLIYTSPKMTLFWQYYDNGESGDDEATKFGAKMGSEAFSIFGQYEIDNGLISISEGLSSLDSDTVNTADGNNFFEDNRTTGADVWFLGLSYKTGRITLLYEYGERKNSENGRQTDDGHAGWVAGLSIELDTYAYLYLGYLEKEFNDDDRDKDSRYTVGATITF